MTERLVCKSSASGLERKQLLPGFLLTLFGWAAAPLTLVVSAYPALLVDLFGVTRERMHLIALALAHMEAPNSLAAATLLIRGSTRAVLQRASERCPMGIKRAVTHLPPQVIQRQNYLALVDLLDNPESARVLYHAATIDDLAIQTLAELPPSLRRRLSSAVPDWPRTLNGLTQSLQFLVSRGVNSSLDHLVASLATVKAWPQLTALIREWIGSLPLPGDHPAKENWQRTPSRQRQRSLFAGQDLARLPWQLHGQHRCWTLCRLCLGGCRQTGRLPRAATRPVRLVFG